MITFQEANSNHWRYWRYTCKIFDLVKSLIIEHRKYNSPWINKIMTENFGEQPVSKEAATTNKTIKIIKLRKKAKNCLDYKEKINNITKGNEMKKVYDNNRRNVKPR